MKTFVNVIFPTSCIAALIASMGVALGGLFLSPSASQYARQHHARIAPSATLTVASR